MQFMPEYGSDDGFFKKARKDWNNGRRLSCCWNVGKFVVAGLIFVIPLFYLVMSLGSTSETAPSNVSAEKAGVAVNGDLNAPVTTSYTEINQIPKPVLTTTFASSSEANGNGVYKIFVTGFLQYAMGAINPNDYVKKIVIHQPLYDCSSTSTPTYLTNGLSGVSLEIQCLSKTPVRNIDGLLVTDW